MGFEIYKNKTKYRKTFKEFTACFNALEQAGDQSVAKIDRSPPIIYAYAKTLGYKVGTHKIDDTYTEFWIVSRLDTPTK